MRTRERLAEVMRSVNSELYPVTAMVLRHAAEHLDGEAPPQCVECTHNLEAVAGVHESPHIREIANEAWVYLQGVTIQ